MVEQEEKLETQQQEKFGEDRVKDNGERFIELCTQTSLKIWNGVFDHKNMHKYTWEQNTKKKLKTISDYIINKQDLKLKNTICQSLQKTELWYRSQITSNQILFPCIYTTKDKNDEKKENTVTTVDMKRKYNIEIFILSPCMLLYSNFITNSCTY